MDLATAKAEALAYFHERIAPQAECIRLEDTSHQAKAKLVNRAVTDALSDYRNELGNGNEPELLLVSQYASSIASLEYRHSVWPYEYMSFSRRIGELWEKFCTTCWDLPHRPDVQRIEAPNFTDVTQTLYDKLPADKDVQEIFHLLLELVGTINMKEDEVFTLGKIPHVIDFKSGFGSNEKGNTLRLTAVGRAYRLWNPEAKLLLLVRQTENNNYLNVIQRMGLWQVFCGEEAYKQINELTGVDIVGVRKSIVDFPKDLSQEFLEHIDGQLSDLRSYLSW